LGHGHARSEPAARDANPGGHQSDAAGDPAPPGPGRRWHADLRRRAALGPGRLWSPRHRRVPARRDGDRPVDRDRRQGVPAGPARRHGQELSPLAAARGHPTASPRGPQQVGARDKTVFVLDFGSQFSQLIARRVREANVYCELVPGTTPWAQLKKRHPAGLILSGGPSSVYDADAPQVDPGALRAGVPVLGICYGMQLIAQATESIRAHVVGGRVICALSGGVDSAVAATLVHRAVGDQLTCVFVNNGLLRKEEPERVLDVMHGNLDMDIRYVDATERFL